MYHRSPFVRSLRRTAFAVSGLGLAAGAGQPEVRLAADSDPEAARTALREAAAAGAVPFETDAAAFGLDREAIARAAADGVAGLEVRFSGDAPASADAPADEEETTEVNPRPRLVVRFGAAAASACAPTDEAEGAPRRSEHVESAFCQGEEAIARTRVALTEPAQDAAERAVWRSTRRLFPDAYAENYGFGLFGPNVSVGVGVGVGF